MAITPATPAATRTTLMIFGMIPVDPPTGLLAPVGFDLHKAVSAAPGALQVSVSGLGEAAAAKTGWLKAPPKAVIDPMVRIVMVSMRMIFTIIISSVQS
jgi:hypothetical protein